MGSEPQSIALVANDDLRAESTSLIPYLQIGRGRLGSTIIEMIKSEPQLARLVASTAKFNVRLNPKNGLSLVSSSIEPVKIDKLLICIAPGVNKKWSWNDIFSGLMNQVKLQQLFINEIIFISSTRVYDGISSGIVTAQTSPKPQSDRAEGLVIAEKQLAQLAKTHCFLRCCGLIGEQYLRFQEILQQPDDKVRFAVGIQQVAEKVIERLSITRPVDQYSIVTDGGCYYRGDRLAFEQSSFLSKDHRLLKQSDCFE